MTTHDTDDFFGPVKTPEQIAKEIFAARERPREPVAATPEVNIAAETVTEVAPEIGDILLQPAVEASVPVDLVESRDGHLVDDSVSQWSGQSEMAIEPTEAEGLEPAAEISPTFEEPLPLPDVEVPVGADLVEAVGDTSESELAPEEIPVEDVVNAAIVVLEPEPLADDAPVVGEMSAPSHVEELVQIDSWESLAIEQFDEVTSEWSAEDEVVEAVAPVKEPESVLVWDEHSESDRIDAAPPLAETLLPPESHVPVEASFTLETAEEFTPPPPPVIHMTSVVSNGHHSVVEAPDPVLMNEAPEVVRSDSSDEAAVSSREDEWTAPTHQIIESSPTDDLQLPDPDLVVDASFSLSVHEVVPAALEEPAPLSDEDTATESHALLERLRIVAPVASPEPLVIMTAPTLFDAEAEPESEVSASVDAPQVPFDQVLVEDQAIEDSSELSTGQLPELSELSEAAEAFFKEPVGSFGEEPVGRHAKKLEGALSPEETAREIHCAGRLLR